MNKMTKIIIMLVVLALLFYFFAPIKDSPLSGGPVSASNPPKKLRKISIYEFNRLKKDIFYRNIVE